MSVTKKLSLLSRLSPSDKLQWFNLERLLSNGFVPKKVTKNFAGAQSIRFKSDIKI
jgi:hypothetical protein